MSRELLEDLNGFCFVTYSRQGTSERQREREMTERGREQGRGRKQREGEGEKKRSSRGKNESLLSLPHAKGYVWLLEAFGSLAQSATAATELWLQAGGRQAARAEHRGRGWLKSKALEANC